MNKYKVENRFDKKISDGEWTQISEIVEKQMNSIFIQEFSVDWTGFPNLTSALKKTVLYL